MMLGFAEIEHLKLSNGEVISEESNLCDHNTSTSRPDGPTDGRLYHSNTTLCVASRGKMHLNK